MAQRVLLHRAMSAVPHVLFPSGHLRVAARTSVGRVRDRNEDYFAIDLGAGLVVVADGIGGHESGEVASRLAVETIVEAFVTSEGELADRLEHALQLANQRVFAQATADPRHRMGTTCVALALQVDRLVIAHAGDSRAYRFREQALMRLTRDHSFLEQYPSSAADVRRHNSNAITRAIGLHAVLEPDIATHAIARGDRYLLCSDGLTNMISDLAIAATLGELGALEPACDVLVRQANDAGGRDNITVALVEIV